ncbi:hypothetical protein HUF15_00785 [Streptomyces samsunensis]|uniref:hypothetical protein n=1 Tax=Streptomyces malaysiensis TaxID=92644 RepID=UPI001582D4F0|nr:hypothetical protein [Streptomyces samsunensis]NUH35317.1 hypothetical protein [Streptomyces samsunensis]
MSAFTVAAAIAAIEGADWLPPFLHWEIATTDGVWGAHAEIDAQSEAQAYRQMKPLAELHGSELADDGRSVTVDFVLDEVPFRFWWLRPIKQYIVPEQCATCPTKLSGAGVSFVRLGAGSEAPVICVPCRDRMHARWVKGDAARDAEVLREAADAIAALPQDYECDPGRGDAAELLRRMADEAGKVTPTAGEITQPAGPTVYYRASHDSIVMGRYTTAVEARKHCETEERRSWPTGTTLTFDWIEDEEDGVAELTVVAGQNEESVTGYVVTTVEVASEYDEEADE